MGSRPFGPASERGGRECLLIGEDIHRREHEFLVPNTCNRQAQGCANPGARLPDARFCIHALPIFPKLHGYNASKKLCPTSSKSRNNPEVAQPGYDHADTNRF
jgi:hypothetical protein